ncbi:MAG: ferric reductase-like transmembrane domain-containing protein [Polyangiales bacterium]
MSSARGTRLEVCGAAAVSGAAAGLAFVWRGDADAYDASWAWTRSLGWLTLVCLCAALLVTPLVQLRRWLARRGAERPQAAPSASRLRRVLGVAAFGCGTLHAGNALWFVPDVAASLSSTASLRVGLAAWVILAALAITSLPAVLQRWRLKAWKELHRLAYVALPLALLHAAQASFVPLQPLLWLGAATLLFGLLRVLPARR